MHSLNTSEIDDIKRLISMMTADVCIQASNWLNAQKELLASELPMDMPEWPMTMPLASSVSPVSISSGSTAPSQPQPARKPSVNAVVPVASGSSGSLATFHAMQHARNQKQLTTLYEREKAMDEIRSRACACRMCSLGKAREDIMWSTGPFDASIMFVAAGGNPDEPKCGRIMTGEAAELFDKIISAMSQLNSEASAERIYITNIIKCACMPPKQKKEDIARSCLGYLRQEIRIVSPKVIVVWGALVYHAMFGGQDPISQVRGKWQLFEGIPTIATHHPLEMISNPKLKGRVWADLQLAVAKIKEL